MIHVCSSRLLLSVVEADLLARMDEALHASIDGDAASEGVARCTPHRSGKSAALIAQSDWSETSLGPRERWSPTLKQMLQFCLDSTQPLVLVWGHAHAQLFNDAFFSVCG